MDLKGSCITDGSSPAPRLAKALFRAFIARPMRIALLTFLVSAATLGAQQVKPPSPVAIGEAEATKVEEKISTVRRDIIGKYGLSLTELQNQFQKAADLEGALAVRAERERLTTEQVLSEKNYVKEPKALQALQQQWVAKLYELVSGVVNEAVPKLVEFKKQLTIEGKLDEALAIKQAIERLQNANVPITRTEAGSIIPAETLLGAYSADRSRADKTYKGVRISVRGVIAGYRMDPNDAKELLVYLSGPSGGGWIECSFSLKKWRYREDKLPAGAQLVLIAKDGAEIRLARGQQADILGDCAGWEEMVRLKNCDVGH
jgi:hypothetical protein